MKSLSANAVRTSLPRFCGQTIRRAACSEIARATTDGITDRPDIQFLKANIYLNARRYKKAYEMFGKIMSISDDLMWKYFEYILCWPSDKVQETHAGVAGGELHPRTVKDRLAQEVVRRFIGKEEADPDSGIGHDEPPRRLNSGTEKRKATTSVDISQPI